MSLLVRGDRQPLTLSAQPTLLEPTQAIQLAEPERRPATAEAAQQFATPANRIHHPKRQLCMVRRAGDLAAMLPHRNNQCRQIFLADPDQQIRRPERLPELRFRDQQLLASACFRVEGKSLQTEMVDADMGRMGIIGMGQKHQGGLADSEDLDESLHHFLPADRVLLTLFHADLIKSERLSGKLPLPAKGATGIGKLL